MALADILNAARATPISGTELRLHFNIMPAGEYSVVERAEDRAADAPMVSCLMVTTGERPSIQHAIECYSRQTYANRELVVVTHPDGLETTAAFVAASGAPNVSVHCVGREMTLGDCRNLAIARAAGRIVMQWDDDDLSDPLRVAVAVSVLIQSAAVAVVLCRVLIWWPQRRLAAISERRIWEGSIAVWREHAPAYPSLARAEDTPALAFLVNTRRVATYDCPLLYVYTAHAANTWGQTHFEQLFQRAECVIDGAAYVELLALLAQRTPVVGYQADLPPRGTTPALAGEPTLVG
jgi:glycosyltransferase involved in cell wall biosynthesis